MTDQMNDPRFTRDNSDGTTTCGNGQLIVTLPTSEFEKIGRHGVFSRAMEMMGNRSEAELLKSKPVSTDDIMRAAYDQLVRSYIVDRGRYSCIETVTLMICGKSMAPGMQQDVDEARAYAQGILNPITFEQMRSWANDYFDKNHMFIDKNDLTDPKVNRKYQRAIKIEQLRMGTDADRNRAEVLASVEETLQRNRERKIAHRFAIGQGCQGWEIEIVGEMPERIGLCRYKANS